MTRTIIVNDNEFAAFDWTEARIPEVGEDPPLPPHARNEELLKNGVTELRPGEARFHCDQTLAFDTTFELKGDGRKFVVISSQAGEHAAKPY
jgi:hypothetical protein